MGKLFIAGNGFDIAHKMKTSYQDFYSFLELAQHVCEITKRENASLSWDNLKQDDKERIKENEWLNQFPTETIKVNIIKYLLKSNNKKKTSYKSYNAWNIYVKYMENNQLLAYLMKTRIGIEDGLVAIINQGNIKAEQLLCELIEVTRTFIYYMKIVVFECYAQEYYTMNHKRNSFTVISTYDKIAEELETTIKILNFNFTNLFDLYGKGKLNKEVNGTVKDYTLIFGVNGSVILDNGKRIDDTDYRILTKEYIKGLFHAANSQLFSGSGNDEIRELMEDIGEVVIYGHSMAAADSKILHDIFTYPGLRNIRVYYYSEQDKENYKKLFSEQEFPEIERITEYVCSQNAQVRNIDDMDGMQIQIRQEEVIARNIKGYITTMESLKRVINSNLIDDLKAGYLEE